MKNKVLIITHTKDNECIETVSRAIQEQGGVAVRFNVDRYPLDYRISTSFKDGEWQILLKENDGTTHDLTKDFLGLWNRRLYNLGDCLKDSVESNYVTSCVGESHATFIGMISHLEQELVTLNSYSENRKSSIKEMQLRIAEEFGLKIPRTCISNDVEEVKAFIQNCSDGVVAKMQHAFSVYNEGVENVVYTNEVDESDFEELEAQLRFCPMKFQEKIQKKLELRITIVGEQVFAAAFDSQKMTRGEIDWRRVGEESIGHWEPYEIPEDLKMKLLRLHQFCNLNYGATDVILTPEDEYIFLESNPGGEFFWLDQMVDYEISNEIAKVLLNKVEAASHSSMALLV